MKNTSKKMLCRVLSFLLVPVILGTGLQQAEAQQPAACRPFVVGELPLQEEHGHFATSVVINGHPQRMLIDTGAARTGITQAVGKALAMPQNESRSVSVLGIGGRAQPVHPLIAHSIKFGSLELANYDVDVLPANFARLEAVGDPQAPTGLVGRDILSHYDVEFDFPNKKMRLYSVANCQGRFIPWSGTFDTFAPRFTPQGGFLIEVDLNGHPLQALIDTGSHATTTWLAPAMTVGVEETALARDQTFSTVGAQGSEIKVYKHPFESMRVGTSTFKNISIAVEDGTFTLADMLLGTDFLRWRKVWLSFGTKQVFIQYKPITVMQ